MMEDGVLLDISAAPPCASCRFAVFRREAATFKGFTKWLVKPIYGEDEIVSIGCSRVKMGRYDLMTGDDLGYEPVMAAEIVRQDQGLCGLSGRWHMRLDPNSKQDV